MKRTPYMIFAIFLVFTLVSCSLAKNNSETLDIANDEVVDNKVDNLVKISDIEISDPLENTEEKSEIPEKVDDLEKVGLRNLSLKQGEKIVSPSVITGEARGWFFEGSFPVELVDSDGKIIIRSLATAVGDWMIDDYVSFKISLDFDDVGLSKGSVILKKDNPSGLPEFDYSYAIDVLF